MFLTLLVSLNLFSCFVRAAYEPNAIEIPSGLDLPSSSSVDYSLTRRPKQKSPAAFKKGQSRRGLVVVKDTLQERAEQYFDGKSTTDLPGDHYKGQNNEFEHAMQQSCNEVQRKYPNEVDISAMAKRIYMKKIDEYHHRRIMMKARERLKRVNKIETTLEEFKALRNHFFNNDPMEGSTPAERKRLIALKAYYRKQLKLGNYNVLENMKQRGWTLDSLKKHILPSNDEIMAFLDRYREEREAATAHVSIPVGRSNPELDLDLNEALSDEGDIDEEEPNDKDQESSLNLHLEDMQIISSDNGENHLSTDFYNDDNQDLYSTYDADYDFTHATTTSRDMQDMSFAYD